MQVAYWIIAGLLAVLYLYSGVLKIIRSKDQLRPMMQWVDDMPLGAIRAIGVLEVLGAIGLILPPLLGILPWLAFAAAIGLTLLQVGAIIVHVRRHDTIWLNLGVIVLSAVEIWLATIWL